MVNSCRIEQLGVRRQIGRIDPSTDKARESAKQAPFRQSNPAAAFVWLAFSIISYF
jgi:hypothetical protein